MPASTMEPITGVLRNAFGLGKGGGGGGAQSQSSSGPSSLESGLHAVTKKSLLAPVAFDAPVVARQQQQQELSAAGSTSASPAPKYILLNPGYGKAKSEQQGEKRGILANGTKNGDGESSEPAAPPKPKITFFPLSSVEVGYKSSRVPGAGMFNMGNTCYLNSTLQALFHTPALFNYLTSGSHSKQCKSGGGGGNGFYPPSTPCMICALTLTLRETLHVGVMRPNKIYDRLKIICKHMVHGRQEDAHEFLRYLIEALQRSFLQSVHASKNLDNPSKETTPFNQIFGGYLRQDVTCLRCKNVSITFQHFMDVLLDIRQASNVQDALDHYFRAERIGGSGDSGDQTQNMYKCEKCKMRVPARKKCFIERPPVVLCIQLKRFNLMGGKISKPVSLSRFIEAQGYVKKKEPSARPLPPLRYKLVSMITHVGPSPNCGHYTAIGEAGAGHLYQFDDSSVRQISQGQALNTASYVVFYEMSRQTKQAWIDGETSHLPASEVNGGANQQHRFNKPATVTSGNVVTNGHTGAPSPAPSAKTMIGPQLPNRIGVVRSQAKSSSGIRGLVPYGTDPDDTPSEGEDEDEKPKPPNGNGSGAASRDSPRPSPHLSRASPLSGFVPRSVQMNALKRNSSHSEPRPATPNTQVAAAKAFQEAARSASRSSVSTAAENGANVKSTSGQWKVTDQETHNPSVNSDNSTGSTSSWTVTQQKPASASGNVPQVPRPPPVPLLAESKSVQRPDKSEQRSLLKSSNLPPQNQSAIPLSVRLNANGGLGSPERSLKRGNSIEEYEADLDRGRTKKVKKHREGDEGASAYGNPFQNYQNRSNSSGGGDRKYDRSRSSGSGSGSGSGRSSSASNRSWSGSSSGGGGGYNSWPHRDHSYNADHRGFGGGGGDRHHNGGGGGGPRRSYSHSSLSSQADFYRDSRHSHHQKNRYHNSYGRGRGNGGRPYQQQQHYRDYRGYRDYKR